MLVDSYLTEIDVEIDDVVFQCYVDFQPADRSVGLGASAWLCHAFVKGVDLESFLSDTTRERIEEYAAWKLEGN